MMFVRSLRCEENIFTYVFHLKKLKWRCAFHDYCFDDDDGTLITAAYVNKVK